MCPARRDVSAAAEGRPSGARRVVVGRSTASGSEPSRAEILKSRLVANGLLRGLYRHYVDQMGLRGDERVLDYGSGGGAVARHLAERLTTGGGRLTCMDVSARWQRTVKRALRTHATVEYRRGDVRAMALPDGSFDVVLVHWVLHDVPAAGRPSVVAELVRLLRPGGRLFVREPTAAKHGMPAREARKLLGDAGLQETLATQGRAPVLGVFYRAVWTKPA